MQLGGGSHPAGPDCQVRRQTAAVVQRHAACIDPSHAPAGPYSDVELPTVSADRAVDRGGCFGHQSGPAFNDCDRQTVFSSGTPQDLAQSLDALEAPAHDRDASGAVATFQALQGDAYSATLLHALEWHRVTLDSAHAVGFVDAAERHDACVEPDAAACGCPCLPRVRIECFDLRANEAMAARLDQPAAIGTQAGCRLHPGEQFVDIRQPFEVAAGVDHGYAMVRAERLRGREAGKVSTDDQYAFSAPHHDCADHSVARCWRETRPIPVGERDACTRESCMSTDRSFPSRRPDE